MTQHPRTSPAMSPLAMVFWLLVRAYQLLVSPILGPRCRFAPSCSEYAVEALARHGALRGTWLAVRRISKCHPWGGSGYDPVPRIQHRPVHDHDGVGAARRVRHRH
jgi:putative membrane protein insertion efficiency factor